MNKLDFKEQESKDWLKGLLKETTVGITFTKVDGTERDMRCTLNEKVIPALNVEQTASTKKHQETEGVLRVWDVDKESWRSFRWDSIRKIDFQC